MTSGAMTSRQSERPCDHPDDYIAIVWPIVSCQACGQEWLAREEVEELRALVQEANDDPYAELTVSLTERMRAVLERTAAPRERSSE